MSAVTTVRRHLINVVLLRLILQAVNAQDDPKITREIWPEIKRVGMTAYLNCTVSCQSNNRVFWIQKETMTILTSDDRVEVDNVINEIVDGQTKYDIQMRPFLDMTTYMLIIRRLVLTDAGIYTCQIIVKSSSNRPSKDGVLVVEVPPSIVQSETTQIAYAVEGGGAKLNM